MRGNREDGPGATPRPRAFRRLAGRPQPAPKTVADVAADAHVPVEDVLREVADFRLALETDMIIAAAAVDAESPELLSEVIDGERLELATFHDRLLERLADAAADDEIAVRRRARQPRRSFMGRASQAVAVAAAALAVFGATRAVTGTPETSVDATEVAAMETADQHYADFSSAVTSESPGEMREAAQQLHRTLQQLIDEHADDPAVAQRAAQLLQAEISLLRANDPQGASQVLAQARTLIGMLERAAPPKVRASVQPVLDAAVAPPTQRAKPKKTASPSPSPTAKPTTPPPSPTSTPRATSSPDDDSHGPLDTP